MKAYRGGGFVNAAAWLMASGLVLGLPAAGRADIAFTLGNNPQQPGQQNVLANEGLTGSTVTGNTNQTNTLVNFFSSTQTLNTPANGQSRVIAVNSGGTQIALNNITVSVPNFTFTHLIFNPVINQGQGPGSAGSATVTVSALSATNAAETFSFSYALGNGNNFLTIDAINGEKIVSANISAANGFSDLEQVRLNGLAPAVSAVPEPSTLVMACSGVVLGIGGWIRRRRGPRA